MTKLKLHLALLFALALSACDDPPDPDTPPTFGDAGEVPSDTDAGADEKPERKGPQYAVVSGDFKSTSVSLLGLDGTVLADDYINSGSARAGLVSLLSGDVVLPTVSHDPGVLVLIDRLKTDVVTRIRMSDAKVLGQVKTHTPAEQGATSQYNSNPQDYLRVSDDTAWVSRAAPNLNPNAPEIDKGNDLLAIDPSTMQRTDVRIDLSRFDTTGTRKNFDTGQEETVPVYARPTRMVRIGDVLVVALNRAAFDYSAYGTGMLALIHLDPEDPRKVQQIQPDPNAPEVDRIETLELPNFAGCVYLSPVPDAANQVLVSCTGDFVQERETAGHAIVQVQDDGQATIVGSFRASEYPGLPILSGSAVALGGTLIGAAANSFSGTDASVFGTLNLSGGAFTELASIPGGSGTFGFPHFDGETGLLFLPDSSTDADLRPTGGVRVFERTEEGFTEGDVLKVAEDTTLPARAVHPL